MRIDRAALRLLSTHRLIKLSVDLFVILSLSRTASSRITTQSLDRKLLMSPNEADRSPVLCNKYALDDLEDEMLRWQPPPQTKGKYQRILLFDLYE